ncbi:MAG TPA: VWA domain-containing protein, partial [Opitutales bacterium]|nr:VWA domain-containing protein [Opitutales bacterium]
MTLGSASSFRFETSLWLWVVPIAVIALVWGYLRLRSIRKQANNAFIASHLQSTLLKNISPWRRHIKEALIISGFAMILIGLARPQWGFTWQEVESKGLDLIFLLDTSKSMLAEDIKPNRLQRAKLAIQDLVSELNTDRLGLIIFTGRAFMLCPLTLDYDAFQMELNSVDIDRLPRGGTDLGAAINEGIAALPLKSANKALILISDGEDLRGQGIFAAQQAARDGITIYTIGVGTETGDLIPLRDNRGNVDFVKDGQGKLVKSKLDAHDLEAIADATGGTYAPLGSTGEGLQAIYHAMHEKFPTITQRTAVRKIPIEQFSWFVGLALIAWGIEPLIGLRRTR